MLIFYDRYAQRHGVPGREWTAEGESRLTRAHDWVEDKIKNSKVKLPFWVLGYLISLFDERWMATDMEARVVKRKQAQDRRDVEILDYQNKEFFTPQQP